MFTKRGYAALRRNRWSAPGCRYFLTICTQRPFDALGVPVAANAVRAEVNAIEASGYWRALAGVVMPDHLHLLVELGSRTPLGRIIARLKSRTLPSLRHQGGMWQGNYYEHRLRDSDSLEQVVRYIHLNPYRSQLIAPNETRPWYWVQEEVRAWYQPITNDGAPFPEWLK